MQPQPNSLRVAALAALVLFATATASHAQGLGGMLNKAKAKVGQATSAASAPAQAPTQAAPGTSGELPEPPNGLTVETEQQYAHIVMASTRPWKMGEGRFDGDYWYRRLTIEHKQAIKFTWDEAAVTQLVKCHIGLMNTIEDLSTDLDSWYGSNQAPYFRPALSKVKEIHLTTTTRKPSSSEAEAAGGYLLSYNKTTGVLTATIAAFPDSYYPRSVAADSYFAKYIQANVK